MFKSYWTIAWRTISRNKIYTLVNVAGLALGTCACLVIWVVVHYEFSFDRDRPDRDRIYRINSYEQLLKNEPERLTPMVAADLPAAVRKGAPGVDIVASYRVLPNDTALVTGEKKQPYAVRSIVAGPEYFQVMVYQWLAGNARIAMEQPFGVVLTESRARLYFGQGALNGFIGRQIVYQDSLPVHVTGIVADYPGNTDFAYTDFISWSTVDHSFLLQTLELDPEVQYKEPPVLNVLVKLAPRTDPVRTAGVISNIFKGLPAGILTRVELQPLSQVHFTQSIGDTTLTTRQVSTLYSLLAIAFFILALAIINYVNLATAQSLSREKEITIRKVMGSGRARLTAQLLTETAMLTSLAGMIAVLFVGPTLSLFHEYLPKQLVFQPLSPANLLFLLGIIVTVTLLAGLYPARMFSTHSPARSLSGGNTYRGSGKWWLRKGLIVFQFTVALLFIIGTMTMGRQIGFMMHKELGFRTDAIVEFITGQRTDSAGLSRVKLLEHAIAGLPGVAAVSRNNMLPGGTRDRGISLVYYRRLSDDPIRAETIKADENYIPLFGVRLLAGRNLFPSDTLKEVVINESLSRQLGFHTPDEAVGVQINVRSKDVSIVGVVADFHKYSFREPIQPLLIAGISCIDLAVRLDMKGETAAEAHATLSRIERRWKEFIPHRPFEYYFFDDEIAQMYQREMSLQWLMNIATGITVFISCIGLFGLTLFTTERRTREIGIRKVMGARVTDILTLLGRDFVLLVGIALVIATAGGWWMMHRWLQDYAYRVMIGPDIFLLAGGALLVVTVLTVGIQSLRAALVNPVKSLRTE
ncbi:MAG: hypothetical protein C5B59_16145 [Bacteroidetes bacterium]|nr:MAG: hypothetical protein C5B59_16145 [Bacteroidota bacterium]